MTLAAPVPACTCTLARHEPRLVALTGGPGAGKTAVLEVVRRHFCRHVIVLPEAASILFLGGFPRHATAASRRAAQRAIYRVEVELERMAVEEDDVAVVLCDRGTVDGLAYWPGPESEYWSELGTTRAAELARYAAVIHLRTPTGDSGYNHVNPARRESAAEAHAIDERILRAWDDHPARTIVNRSDFFLDKLERTLAAIGAHVPSCCRTGDRRVG